MANQTIRSWMNTGRSLGIYLFLKQHQNNMVLKDLLQFLKTTSPGKGHSFSYIEAKTSLHPNLSLWENLQLEIGPVNWKEFQHELRPEWSSLLNLIKEPTLLTQDAQVWERFLVSFLKGLLTPTQHLLIDMNEELLSPVLIQNLKKNVLEASKEKTVFLATANTSLWLDCAHTIVDRKDYKFEVRSLDAETIKKHWAA